MTETKLTDSPLIQRIRAIVDPIAGDLELDVYDVEQRGGTLRVTLDSPPGSPAGVDLDQLALATRLISRQLDHDDPVPGRYTLEVTSPGVERSLRTAAHFQREIGKTVNVRLANTGSESGLRRLEGVLVAADEHTATVQVADTSGVHEHVIELASIERARTVFVWGPQPKPGQPKSKSSKSNTAKSAITDAAGSEIAAEPSDPSDPIEPEKEPS